MPGKRKKKNNKRKNLNPQKPIRQGNSDGTRTNEYNKDRFVLTRTMRIGAQQAEEDLSFLRKAFKVREDYEILCDTRDSRSVVVGRTGAGKSALLLKLEEEKVRLIRIRPESLSMQHLSNSTILPHLTELGVHLDLFYKWLWRHFIITALIGHWWDNAPKDWQQNLIQKVLERLKLVRHPHKSNRSQLIDYHNAWGGKYWIHQEVRLESIDQKLRDTLHAELGGEYNLISGKMSAEKAREHHSISKVLHKTHKVLEDLQVKELSAVLEVVRTEILSDPMKPYYILIDDLDKDWVEAAYAYDLIEALLAEVGNFSQIENIKVVVALRQNILDQLNERSASAAVPKRGRQREKLKDYILPITWTSEELEELLNLRLRFLYRSKGGKGEPPMIRELLPKKSVKNRRGVAISGLDYIIDRTFLRPRDAIDFLNECIARVSPDGKLDWDSILEAEPVYSSGRLNSIAEEWNENYPGLQAFLRFIGGMNDGFDIGTLAIRVFDFALEVGSSCPKGSIGEEWYSLIEGETMAAHTLTQNHVIQILYLTGVIGAKKTREDRPFFSYKMPNLLREGVLPETRFYFHPCLYKALGITAARDELK